jgi:transposase-like protein
MVAELGSGAGASADGAAAAGPDWDAVRGAYEAGTERIEDIARRFGVTRAALLWRARRDLWASRYTTRSISHAQLLTRLFRLLERHTIEMDRQMTGTGDKEVAALGKLVATLEKLIEIEERSTANRPERHQSVDMAELRKKLADRIDRLVGE